MAPWDIDADYTHPPGYELAQNGPITVFDLESVLDGVIDDLRQHSYRVIEVNAGRWFTEEDAHEAMHLSMNFPSYYGRNLNALNDCLSDVAVMSYGWSSSDAGLVLVLRRLHVATSGLPDFTSKVLDVIARNATRAMLFGNRWVCLVQTDDHGWSPGPLGATAPSRYRSS